MEQTAKAQLKTGALDREVIEDDYDFVFDESVKINFALDTEGGIAGTMDSGKDAALKAQIDEAERRGESFAILSANTNAKLTFASLPHSPIHRRGPQVAPRLRMA